jgi:hypothetical protein
MGEKNFTYDLVLGEQPMAISVIPITQALEDEGVEKHKKGRLNCVLKIKTFSQIKLRLQRIQTQNE